MEKTGNTKSTPEDVLLKQEGDVFILILNKGSNNFSFDFMRKIHEKLDLVEAHKGPACLITTSSSPKFYSTGLDLPWLTSLTSASDVNNFLLEFQRLIGRVLCFPVPTIAAINGHAFAGGCMLAFAHDFRIMRKGVGFLCMNEVDLGFPLGPGMNAVPQCKLDAPTFRDLILLGKRFAAEEALAKKMIDKAVEGDKLMEESLKLAKDLASKGENKENFFALKFEMYKTAHNACFKEGLGLADKSAGKMMSAAKL
jgi:enoyl-CoA hydratase/carnithine racemase